MAVKSGHVHAGHHIHGMIMSTTVLPCAGLLCAVSLVMYYYGPHSWVPLVFKTNVWYVSYRIVYRHSDAQNWIHKYCTIHGHIVGWKHLKVSHRRGPKNSGPNWDTQEYISMYMCVNMHMIKMETLEATVHQLSHCES